MFVDVHRGVVCDVHRIVVGDVSRVVFDGDCRVTPADVALCIRREVRHPNGIVDTLPVTVDGSLLTCVPSTDAVNVTFAVDASTLCLCGNKGGRCRVASTSTLARRVMALVRWLFPLSCAAKLVPVAGVPLLVPAVSGELWGLVRVDVLDAASLRRLCSSDTRIVRTGVTGDSGVATGVAHGLLWLWDRVSRIWN